MPHPRFSWDFRINFALDFMGFSSFWHIWGLIEASEADFLSIDIDFLRRLDWRAPFSLKKPEIQFCIKSYIKFSYKISYKTHIKIHIQIHADAYTETDAANRPPRPGAARRPAEPRRPLPRSRGAVGAVGTDLAEP